MAKTKDKGKKGEPEESQATPNAVAAETAGADTDRADGRPTEEAPTAPPEEGGDAPAEPETAPAEAAAGSAVAQEDIAQASLEDLRHIGAVAAESIDGGVVTVITKGGRRLRFPGDEAVAAQMTTADLLGVPLENPASAQGPLPSRSLEDLKEMGVLAAKRDYFQGRCQCGYQGPVAAPSEEDYEDIPVECPGCKQKGTIRPGRYLHTVAVTKGGRKLTFPGDEAVAGRLTDEQLDGVSRAKAGKPGSLSLLGHKR